MSDSKWADPKELRTAVDKQKSKLQVKTRAYDAAAIGRLNPHQSWFSLSSADSQIFTAGRALREFSRDLVRNNPHAKAAVKALVTNIVGDGIVPRPMSGNPETDKVVKALFKKWMKRAACDADGQSDFYALQTAVVRQMVVAGEVLVRRSVPSRSMKGYVIPLQLQLLEADYLDSYRLGPGEDGTQIMSGIQYSTTGSNMGKRVAYWLFKDHPGNMLFGLSNSMQLQSSPISADEILHIYDKERTQLRGVPFGVSAFTTLQNLSEYELAEIVRKKTESSVAAIVTTQDNTNLGINPLPEDYLPGDDLPVGVFDGYGNPIEYLEPGLIAYAQNGKDIRFNTPNAVGGYNEYKVSNLRTIASGFGVPYELLSGDLSEVNYSSGRLGLLEFRRFVKMIQNQILIPSFLDPAWEWFCEAAYQAGEINVPYIDVEWAPPAFEYINPADDVAADSASIRAGLRSWEEVIFSNGRDPDVVYAEIERFQKRNRESGVSLDTDPGAVSGRGVAQKNTPGEPTKPDKKKKGKNSKKKNKLKKPPKPGKSPSVQPDLDGDDEV